MLEDRDFLRHQPVPAGTDGPSAVTVLILLNVAAFVLRELFTIPTPVPAGAVSLPALQQGQWWTVMTHLFTHADWKHLGFNMLIFFLTGRRVLADAGQRHFVYIYLVSGWVAAAATLMLHPFSPLIGASGCIAGVFGAFAALHPEESVTRPLGAWVPRLRARSLFLGMVSSTVILEFIAVVTEKSYAFPLIHGVAHGAHAAGLITGWLYARHLSPLLENLYHREDFFPQGLRRRRRDAVFPAVSARSAPRRAGALPDPIFSEAPPEPLTNDEFLRQAVDPVLDKLYAGGMSSLTEAERRILDEAANRFSQPGS